MSDHESLLRDITPDESLKTTQSNSGMLGRVVLSSLENFRQAFLATLPSFKLTMMETPTVIYDANNNISRLLNRTRPEEISDGFEKLLEDTIVKGGLDITAKQELGVETASYVADPTKRRRGDNYRFRLIANVLDVPVPADNEVYLSKPGYLIASEKQVITDLLDIESTPKQNSPDTKPPIHRVKLAVISSKNSVVPFEALQQLFEREHSLIQLSPIQYVR